MKPSPASGHPDPDPTPPTERPTPPKTGRALLTGAGKTAAAVHSALKWLWLAPVRIYRRFLSPLKGQGSCRFTPTCSAYALEAVGEWGILCGTALALFRVLRCNPFSKGGYDPVPKRSEVLSRLRKKRSEGNDPPASQPPMEH